MRRVASVDGRDRRRYGRPLAQSMHGHQLRSLMDSVQPGRSAGLDECIQGHLGAQLRALYQKTLEEPIPDRFLELLHRSDAESQAPGEPGAAGKTG